MSTLITEHDVFAQSVSFSEDAMTVQLDDGGAVRAFGLVPPALGGDSGGATSFRADRQRRRNPMARVGRRHQRRGSFGRPPLGGIRGSLAKWREGRK